MTRYLDGLIDKSVRCARIFLAVFLGKREFFYKGDTCMIAWQQLAEWQKDWLVFDPAAICKRQKILLSSSSREQIEFARAVRTLGHGRARLIAGNADLYFDQIELDSSVATTLNPNRMLMLASKAMANKNPDLQRWFEALSRFDQAIAVSKIELVEPQEDLDRDMNRLLDFLNENFLQEETEKVDIYCYHDPNDGYSVIHEDIGIGSHLSRPGLTRRKSNLTCRQTLKGELAYMRHRTKDPFDTWLKTQRQIHNVENVHPYFVHDRCGLTFIVPNEGDLYNVAVNLVMLLIDDGATEIEPLESNYGVQKSGDANNKHSSSVYKLAKTLIEWNGRVFEFQFLTFHDYFTSKRSLLESNHDLYRLRQALDFFLPLLWPKEVYEVDWSNPNVRSALYKWKRSQLGWRVNGNA